MDNSYDVLIMGAGHNGLVAAAYLAKAGKKVLVLEKNPYAGGGVLTREITAPGFLSDVHSSTHIMLVGNPMMTNDELGLYKKFGLAYKTMERPHATLFQDKSFLITSRNPEETCASIAQFSAKDAKAYAEFAKIGQKMLPMMLQGIYAPPAPMGPTLAMMLGSVEGQEMFQTMVRSPLDFVNEWFEHERTKIHILRPAMELLQFPDEQGTSTSIFLYPILQNRFGNPKAIGGSGKLAEALVNAVEHFGGKVLLNTEVTRVITEKGRAVGLKTNSETYMARDAVIAAIHPKLLDKFVDGVDEGVVARAKRTKASPMAIYQVHLALKEQLKFHAGEEIQQTQMVHYSHAETVDELLMQLDDIRYGRLPEKPILSGQDQTRTDGTRAPAGSGVMALQAFVPYRLPDGGAARWDDVKTAFGELCIEHSQPFVSNMTPDNIIARNEQTPLDHERHSPTSFYEGDIHGIGGYFFQNAGLRPTPELAQYRVPGVDRLYLVGPFMHPGGSVFGGGRNTVMNVFKDLNLDFSKVASKPV
ncbi:MAG: NAD(P)/FAD-dependent oxidoreductase [Parvularculaceae bacterium]